MTSTVTQSTGRVTLEATLRLEEDRAVLEYSVENRGDQAVFVFNRLYDRIEEGGRFHTSPDLVYVQREGRGLVVSKKVPPVPEDVEVERRIVPCATRLGPGERFAETVRLSLPLGLEFPYPLPSEAPLASPAEASFELGYVTVPPEGEEFVMQVETTAGPAWYFSSFSAGKQTVLRVGPFSQRLPVAGG